MSFVFVDSWLYLNILRNNDFCVFILVDSFLIMHGYVFEKKKKKIRLTSAPPIWNPESVPDTYNHIYACELLWIWQVLLGCILGHLDSWNHRTHRNKWSLSLVVMEPRDGYTYWVMDIQPYPIQMFRVIPSFLWVELNWVGCGYYLNCSGRVWILSKPNPY